MITQRLYLNNFKKKSFYEVNNRCDNIENVKIFNKKETLLENIAFMGIMSAINVLISFIIRFIGVFSIFLVLILPLCSTLVGMYCKKRYLIIYLVSAIVLSILSSIGSFETVMFYVIPSILCGLCIGICLNLGIDNVWIIFISSTITILTTYLSIYLFNLIWESDLILFIETLFGLDKVEYFDIFVPSIISIFSFVQVLLSYLIIFNETKKFNKDIKQKKNDLFIYLAILISICLVTIFAFVRVNIAYLFLILVIYFSIYQFIDSIIIRNIINISLFVGSLFIALILYAIFNQKVDMPYTLLLINSFGIINLICQFISVCLSKAKNTRKINNV